MARICMCGDRGFGGDCRIIMWCVHVYVMETRRKRLAGWGAKRKIIVIKSEMRSSRERAAPPPASSCYSPIRSVYHHSVRTGCHFIRLGFSDAMRANSDKISSVV